MKIIKVIEVGLRIDDYLTAAGDLENALLSMLRKKYVGRCYCSCLIKNITRVVKHGIPMIDPVSTNRVNISVRFEVEAVVYARGEVIVGCKIERRDTNKLITCTAGDAIILAEDPVLDFAKVGQFILLEVVDSRYTIMTNNITASAVPFIPPTTAASYKVSGMITDPERDQLSELVISMKQAESEATALKTANARGYEFFEQQLYPFKQQSAPENATIMPISELLGGNLDGKVVSRDPHLGFTSDKLAIREVASADDFMTQYSPYEIAVILITEYVDHMRIIREMISVYNTPELIKSHVGLWLMFKNAKK